MDTNIANIKSVSVGWCLYVLSNTKATFEAQFMKKLSNTEVELEKSVAYKKKRVIRDSLINWKRLVVFGGDAIRL